MITTDNFSALLNSMEFEQLGGKDKNIWRRDFQTCELRADFGNKALIYPEDKGLTVNMRTTCNFDDPENFVVFECVCRLLVKGYRPEHIELEPRWPVGHGPSGGRADILIKDNNGTAYLIIECKTYGAEFDSAWKGMNLNGGQLFTYAQQITGTQFLCLYSSDFDCGKCKYVNHIITLRDNAEYLKSLQNPLAFADATDVTTRFKAWYDTYNHEYETRGIFENAHAAYDIGKGKHTSEDLEEISHDDIQKKYHDFATILRQHNVSGRENAFDKLVNLFLAKIVDEMQSADELKFYWRGVAFDNYYDLQDRIQRLYRDGMQKFLDEEVTYIDGEDIKKAFRLFKNDPDATRVQIEEYFRQLKFYTNNDFAFLDVHNQHLFVQNSAILLKIVRMLQDIKLKTEEQNQFLGDLFEGFLDQGVKQSEGQFFTPTPIVKFLVSSLPLQSLVKGSAEPLRIIDYACGAGHFINEYATQVRMFVPPENLHGYYRQIVGIEKEYRLSKVAKVSAFMYGQDEIQIVYADALAKNNNIKDGSFDVLVSNPPYSVKGFLETLTADNRAAFEIMKVIENKSITTNNSIEAFFVERAKQLLAPSGVAAIILPSSLLVNSGAVYTKAREIVLQYFDIVAIAELSSGTFGKTGTNTVTMFLRRKAENPSFADHYRNRVNTWFGGDFEKDAVFEDAEILAVYCEHVGLLLDDYKTLMQFAPSTALLDTDIFKTYRAAFKEPRLPRRLTTAERESETQRRFIEYCRDIEKDKLYYFMLALSNPQHVVIVKSPTEKQESKRFLGYEWSGRKGSEGIKYLGTAAVESDDDDSGEDTDVLSRLKGIKSINTPLFNPNCLTDESKINSIIRANFDGVSTGDSEFVTRSRLIDMLDFTGAKFDKQISISSGKAIDIVSKYPLSALTAVCEIISGGTPNTADPAYWNGDIPWLSVADFSKANRFVSSAEKSITDAGLNNSNTNILEVNDIIISARGTVGAMAQIASPMAFNQSCYGLRANKNIEAGYLFYALKNVVLSLRESATGSKFKAITTSDLQALKIPLPPIDVQKAIVEACEAVDEEYEHTRKRIEDCRAKIEHIFSDTEIISRGGARIALREIGEVRMCKRIYKKDTAIDGDIPFYKIGTFSGKADAYISLDKYTEYRSKYPFPQKGEVMISAAGTVGRVIQYDGEPAYFQDSNIVWLENNERVVLNRFLYYVLSVSDWNPSQGNTIQRLYNDDIRKTFVAIPPLPEQKKMLKKSDKYEAQIAAAQETLRILDGKRKSVLARFLQ